VSEDAYRLSFEAAAETYERGRPLYAADAVAWLAERIGIGPGRRVLDLGAGTGKLTRQLVALGADVVAVEPGDAMRAQLERVVPGAEALAGSAEEIPLPDASVDAVTAGQAAHWFRHDEALPEIHRVLRPGGGVGLLWNEWDEDDALQLKIKHVLAPFRPPRLGIDRAGPPAWYVAVDDSPLFGPIEEHRFHHVLHTTADGIVDWVASTSPFIMAAPDDKASIESLVREAAGEGACDLVLSTRAFAFARLS
jgi:ubiquinone/menaquinone biosynthesis C-methylase UbiE